MRVRPGTGSVRRVPLAPTRATRLVVVAAVVALFASACWTSYGADWSNSRTAPYESAISVRTAPALRELWRVPGTVGSTSTPAVAGDSVYFGAWDGTVRAVSAADGSPRWTRDVGAIVDASPLVFREKVYVGDAAGNLHALDRATGAPRWTRELDPHPDTRIFSSPVGVDDLVIVGVASIELAFVKPDYTFRGSIVALDAETGALRWRVYTTSDTAASGAGVSVWSSAAIDRSRRTLYIGTGNTYEHPAAPWSDALMAIDYRTGAVRWVRQFTAGDVYVIFRPPPQGPDADIGASPNLFRIGDRDVVGVGDKAGVYAVLDRDTGETVWARQLPTGSHLGGIMTTAAYHDGRIYVSSNRWADHVDFHDPGNVSTTYALDAATGAIVWQTDLPSATFGALTYANGVVFQPTITGTVYAFDAADGSVLWSARPGADLGGGVSVAGGKVFVPYGFWFFAAPPNPSGGLVAYAPDPA
ncbi:MAG: cytochrome CBB3 [Acidimicrobiia bacterium]|nr:MAG: cytochrome CBB3 [Acidimicrobiia bacterium]